MRVRVVVGDQEPIEQALKRLQRQVCQDQASDKWPKWKRCYAKPSEKRRRKRWLKLMKEKWRLVWQRVHQKNSS